MTYAEQWRALASRIRGLMHSGELHAHYLSVRLSGSYGRGKRLLEQGASIFTALESFLSTFGSSLPESARVAMTNFITVNRGLMTRRVTGTSDELQERAWATLVLLGAFETEMTFILADVQESIRARSERALLHLQRSLVVDETLRVAWLKAFDAGEIECERRGAVHMLLHGIWAFKINAAGERTDLVFQEPRDRLAGAERFAEGLVLTEWKKASSEDEVQGKFDEARAQAQRYAVGSLGGLELSSVRYLIAVSRRQVPTPCDLHEDGVIYGHVNIAVEPQVPSRTRPRQMARRMAPRSSGP
jgi:hypothetical protein